MVHPLLKEKKNVILLFSIILGSVLVGSVGYGVIYVQNQKEDTKSRLEAANFTVSAIKITDASSETITLKLTIKTQGLNGSAFASFSPSSLFLRMDISNTSQLEFEVDLEESSIDLENDGALEVEIQLSTQSGEADGSNQLLAAVFAGATFSVPFFGRIRGSVFGVSTSVEFENHLLFDPEEQFGFDITKIGNPENSTATESYIVANITNPFGHDLVVEGDLFIVFASNAIADIILPAPVTIVGGKSVYNLSLELVQSYKETLQFIFDNIEGSAFVQGEMNVAINSLRISTFANFSILLSEEGEPTFALNADDVVLENYDVFSGSAKLVINASITNNLPFDIPVAKINFTISTLNNIEFGQMHWKNFSGLVVKLRATTTFLNITGQLSGVTPILLGVISTDGAIRIPVGTFTILTSQDSFDITFSIERIEIAIPT